MIVNKQKPIEIINNANATFHYRDLSEAILWASDKPVCSKKTVFMHGMYPAISIHGKKYHIHRLLMSFYLNSILPSWVVVHHENGNRLDCCRHNLSLLSSKKHASLHNKGKLLSKDHKKKISKANMRRRGMKMKKKKSVILSDIIPFIKDGWSVNKIAKYYSVDWSTIKSRMNENPELLTDEGQAGCQQKNL